MYNVLSAKNLTLNVKFEHDKFTTPKSRVLVNGSCVRASFHVIRTAREGRVLEIFFHAKDPHRAIITEGCTAPYCRDRRPGARRRPLPAGAQAAPPAETGAAIDELDLLLTTMADLERDVRVEVGVDDRPGRRQQIVDTHLQQAQRGQQRRGGQSARGSPGV